MTGDERQRGEPWLRPEPSSVGRPSWARSSDEGLDVRPWFPGAPVRPTAAKSAGPRPEPRPEPKPEPKPEPRPEPQQVAPEPAFSEADLELLREEVLAEARVPYLAAAEAFAAATRELSRELHEDVVDLALRIAEAIVRREVALDRTVVLDVARRALRLAGPVSRVTVKCATEDAPYLREHLDVIAREESGTAVEVMVRPSDDIDLGGCLVTFDRGVVDARISRQLERLGDAVKAALADAAPDPTGPPVDGGDADAGEEEAP